MRKILAFARRCIEDYDMISDGDKIAVGISGGKDSLTLTAVLAALRKFYPNKFELCGITLDMGYESADFSPIARFCEKINVPYYVHKTNIKEVVFDIRKEENPCSLCARLRRGALHDAALSHGFSKIALGHHFDDAIETFMLSLVFEGRINCFRPVTFLDRKGITMIRPLLYVKESLIKSFAQRTEIPVGKNPCQADGATKRQEIKELIKSLGSKYSDFDEKIFRAMQRLPLDGWKKDSK